VHNCSHDCEHLNGPVPYQVSMTLARPEPEGQKIKPSKGTITDQWSRDPLSESGHHRCPRFQRTTDQQLVGWPDHEPTNPADVKKDGATSCHPVMALLIRGSKPDPRRVRTGAPDRQSQGRQGRAHSSLSSSSPARGRPTSCIQEPMRAASRGRASAPSVLSKWDRALPSKPT
jgi:hypothetical protein